jgi:prevent-host-death family protein
MENKNMPEYVFNLYEAKTSLSRLVDRAAAGEEIVIAKAGVPMAKLIPLSRAKGPRKPGGWKGKIRIAKNFDEPLPEQIQTILEGRSHEDE